MNMQRSYHPARNDGETSDGMAQANEIDLEDIALTEEASKALFEQLKAAGVEPSQAVMEARAKWTDAGELLLFYTVQGQSSDQTGQTLVMQIPAEHWGVDIQQSYLH